MDTQQLINMKEVCKRTSLSRTAINRHRASGAFPRAVILGEQRIAFVASEVDAWIASQIAARDRVSK